MIFSHGIIWNDQSGFLVTYASSHWSVFVKELLGPNPKSEKATEGNCCFVHFILVTKIRIW